jgi:hypothetical protein
LPLRSLRLYFPLNPQAWDFSLKGQGTDEVSSDCLTNAELAWFTAADYDGV